MDNLVLAIYLIDVVCGDALSGFLFAVSTALIATGAFCWVWGAIEEDDAVGRRCLYDGSLEPEEIPEERLEKAKRFRPYRKLVWQSVPFLLINTAGLTWLFPR